MILTPLICGYVGFDDGGQLTEAVRRRPFSVLLLDEIEKAHPDVFNVLLQAMDDGRMTDGRGRTVDFRNTVIIMTSNLAAEQIQQATAAGEATEKVSATALHAARQFFRPEFFNRIDECLVFSPLNLKQMRHIVDIALAQLDERLAATNIQLKIPNKNREQLAKDGFIPELGARPLKRLLQTRIENPLAELFLRQPANDQAINVVMNKDGSLSVKS